MQWYSIECDVQDMLPLPPRMCQTEGCNVLTLPGKGLARDKCHDTKHSKADVGSILGEMVDAKVAREDEEQRFRR